MSKWMKELGKMEGAVDREYDWFAPENVLRSTSPSLNWTFGKGCGLPLGLTGIVWGLPKSGKTLIANLFISGLHQQFGEGDAVKFNTEMREGAQLSKKDMVNWKINPDRYQAFDVNEPDKIFDYITNDFVPKLEEGWPLKLIIIDSMEGVGGVKAGNKESILGHTIGDHALTIGEGLKRILPIIRKYKIAVLCTSHTRANVGAIGTFAPKTKMAGGYAQKHWFEYYIEVKRDNSAESKVSATGEKFESKTRDLKGNADKTGHKIWCKMTESSVGVAGRAGQFTMDYGKGIINTEEEVFELSKNLSCVERPNNRTYVVGDQKFGSKKDFILAIRERKDLRNQLLDAVYEIDKS